MFKKGIILSVVMLLIVSGFLALFDVEAQFVKNNSYEGGNKFEVTHSSESIFIPNLQDDVLISSDNPDNDDMHPKITKNGETLVVAYESVESQIEKSIQVDYSQDEGVVWMDKFNYNSKDLPAGSGVLQSPDIKYAPDADEFFLTMADPLAETNNFHLVWIPGDIVSAENTKWWQTYMPDGRNYRWRGRINSTACTFVSDWFLGLHTSDIFVIELWDQYDFFLEQTLCLGYLHHDKNTDEILWPKDYHPGWVHDPNFAYYLDGQLILDTAPSCNLEMATGSNRVYVVTEHYNDTIENYQIVFKATITDVELLLGTLGGGPKDMDKYADIEAWPWQQYLLKGVDPDISANRNEVYVVCSSQNIAGDNDIICAYSTDAGDSWNFSFVANEPNINEMYPAVFATDSEIYCCYVKSGNLYLVLSKNKGKTWSTPIQINDVDGTIVEEPGTVDLIDKGIVWTDSRNGKKDIFFNRIGPEIKINIASGFGLSIEICNWGNTALSVTDWSITIDGPLIFTGKSQSGQISEIKPRECINIESSLIVGVGPCTITIQVGDVTISRTGFILGPFIILNK